MDWQRINSHVPESPTTSKSADQIKTNKSKSSGIGLQILNFEPDILPLCKNRGSMPRLFEGELI